MTAALLRDALSSKILRPVCELLAGKLPGRTIYDRNGVSPYLSRFYFLGRRSFDKDEKKSEWSLPFNLFLHRFHRGDDDGALHSHPWKWSVALILVGGYSEERRLPGSDTVERRLLLPLSLNVIRESDYHRVDLLGSDVWTLFLAGPRVGTWYFWDRDLKKRAKWDRYIDWLRDKDDPCWEPDSFSVSKTTLDT